MSAFGGGSGAGMKIAGIAGVVAVLAGGCAAAYAFSDTVKNQVKLAFSKPEDYFTWVYEKNTTDLAELCGTGYQQSVGRKDEGETDTAELRLEPSQDFRSYLIDELLYDSAEQDAIDFINSTDSIAFKMNSTVRGNAATASVAVLRNDDSVTSLDIAADLNASRIFGRVPELSERWVTADIAAAAEDYLSGQSLMLNTGELPAAQEIADMVKRYGMMFVQDVQTVTVEKKTPVQISGISVEYTAMTAELTADQFLNTMQTYVDTASADSTLHKLVADDAGFRTAMVDAGEQIRQLRSMNLGGQTVKMVTYVDATGTIRGHFITMGSDVAYFGALGMADDRIAGELKFSVAGTKVLGCKLDATRDGAAVSGNASLAVAGTYGGSDMTMNLSFDKIEVVNAEQGYCSGSMTLTASEEDFPSVTVTLSSDGSSQTLSVPLEIEDVSVGTIKLIYSREAGGSVTMPDTAGAFEVDPSGYDIDWSEYVTEDELIAYLEAVTEKLGLSGSILS